MLADTMSISRMHQSQMHQSQPCQFPECQFPESPLSIQSGIHPSGVAGPDKLEGMNHSGN